MARNSSIEFEVLPKPNRPDAGFLGIRTRLRGLRQHVELHATVMAGALVIGDIAELRLHFGEWSSDGDRGFRFQHGASLPDRLADVPQRAHSRSTGAGCG